MGFDIASKLATMKLESVHFERKLINLVAGPEVPSSLITKPAFTKDSAACPNHMPTS